MLATWRPAEALPASPSPPIYRFDGRLTSFRSSHGHRLNGFIQAPLHTFNPHADFTVSAWVYAGEPEVGACALAIETPNMKVPILSIAEYDKNRFFVARIRRDGGDPNKRYDIDLSTARVGQQFSGERWYHLSLVKDERRMRFFLDDALVDSLDCEQLKPYDAPKPQLVIGRSSQDGDRCHQWGGTIEAVKIWDRAVTLDEIKETVFKKPSPAGLDASRFT
ncbi:hypothetical protein BDW22DRAFT_1209960 [Trametopsis cervina]|nr:hypothetical protein BDW22DRAFT_1209960 [Trametopsis cervina]